jgi:predicted RNA-binding protein Jag
MTLLTGKSAKMFLQRMKETEAKKLSSQERKQIQDNHQKMRSIISKSNG